MTLQDLLNARNGRKVICVYSSPSDELEIAEANLATELHKKGVLKLVREKTVTTKGSVRDASYKIYRVVE